MWNPWKKKLPESVPQAPVIQTPEPAPVIHEITPQISVQDLLPNLPGNVLLRKMKWVTDSEGLTGIITDFDASGNALIHYTNPLNGTTIRQARVRCSAIRLAKYSEIPEVRRVGLTRQAAAVLGYF